MILWMICADTTVCFLFVIWVWSVISSNYLVELFTTQILVHTCPDQKDQILVHTCPDQRDQILVHRCPDQKDQILIHRCLDLKDQILVNRCLDLKADVNVSTVLFVDTHCCIRQVGLC